jgi:hypothetical protein
MPETSSISSVSTFVVRFWREWSADAVRWRGRIEHVQSGEAIVFQDLGGMLGFVRRFGVAVEDKLPHGGS